MDESISSAFSLESVLVLLDQIKIAFARQPEKFSAFKNTWSNYLQNEIEAAEALRRFGILFAGHSDIAAAFNLLMPSKFYLGAGSRQVLTIENSDFDEVTENCAGRGSIAYCKESEESSSFQGPEDHSRQDDIDKYLCFLEKVKIRYADNPEVIHEFLEILQSYLACSEIPCEERSSVKRMKPLIEGNIVQDFEELFSDDVELLAELKEFTLGNHEEPECIVEDEVDSSAVDLVKYGKYEEFKFFDEVRHQMGNEETYMNFMRCLQLFACSLISGSELVAIIEPFVVRAPKLMRQLKDMIGIESNEYESLSNKSLNFRRNQHSDIAMEIDYSSSRKQGVSYRALPASFQLPTCSTRTPLCSEVLNDTWVSFPLWSEDTTFGNSKITAYQEFLYRCEDERFELQIVIDSVSSTIVILEELCEKMEEMSPEDRAKFKLDDRLGGTSEVLQRKSIQRIYGDRANQIISGLKENPSIAVPIALRRLKAKTQEWKEHQERFNILWKELNVKNYQKSLCNDASSFKQNDLKDIKTRNLLQEAEAVYWENQTQMSQDIHQSRGQQFVYSDKGILYDESLLMSHYLSHLPTVQNDDGFLISKLLIEFLPQVFYIPGLTTKEDNLMNGSKEMEEIYTLMYSTSDWYLFVRLHHKLYERLLEIRTCCQSLLKLGLVHGDLMLPNGVRSNNPYEYVLLMTQCLVEGTIENSAYEDQLRSVFETYASSMFALDRLLQNIMKQLQHIASDELNRELMKLFEDERSRGGAGGLLSASRQQSVKEMAYWHKAYQLLPDECYKIVFYKYRSLVTLEMVYSERPVADNFDEVKHWTAYVDNYVNSDSVDVSVIQKPLFLKRNLQHSRWDAVRQYYDGKRSPVVACNNLQCSFSMNSYKMVYAMNSWDLLKFHAVRRTTASMNKCRSLKNKKLLKWLSGWKHNSITNEQERRFREWFTGHKSSRGRNRQQYEHSFTPYRQCKKNFAEKRT